MSIISIIYLLLAIIGICGAGLIIFAAILLLYDKWRTNKLTKNIPTKYKKEVTNGTTIKDDFGRGESSIERDGYEFTIPGDPIEPEVNEPMADDNIVGDTDVISGDKSNAVKRKRGRPCQVETVYIKETN